MMYEFIPQIMREASKIMLSAHDIDTAITEKSGDANFVTAYDVAVEEFLFAELKKHLPDAVIIGEESDDNHMELLNSSLALIVDPIDGTTNFIHNYRTSCISVGICDHGKMAYGAVYNPYMDILYRAERGCGAFMEIGGRAVPMHVSDRHLADSLTAYGTSPYYREELGRKTFETSWALFQATRDIRRSGSAALDLAAVASGSVDIFFECRLSPWDIAAGSLLIEEAGGVITQFDGSPITFEAPCPIAAGNPVALREAMERGIFG
ncbi:MAG: inositol monophosphatase [Clostridia bacterium]|nr:inositol monophosphatase [Clostridia bacterium]MBQ8368458.1 inositol monophosphatase [Clostridia bacterium]